jgi:hypothetical protein
MKRMSPFPLFILLFPAVLLGNSYDVKQFGAAGDKKTKDTAAVQAAIDACSKGGGGTVYFPPGDYLCGTLRLLSNVNLSLSVGATIWGSREPSDYTARCLIFAEGAEHVSIEGRGAVRGIGDADLGRRAGVPFEPPKFRPGLVNIFDSKDISIKDVTFLFSDTWTLNLRDSEDILIDGVTIRNNYFHTNSDGIDPVSCRNVRIANCNIAAGDDCIVVKSTKKGPCENMVITNCVMESIATAVKIGTETPGDFRNIHFSNCTIRNSTVGIGIYLKDGATIERVSFSNISVENYHLSGATNLEKMVYPIFFDIERRHKDSLVGKIRDVTIENIQIRSGLGAVIQGMPESPIENLTLRDILFRVDRPEDYSDRRKHIGGTRTTSDERDTLFVRQPSYVTLAHVNGLTVDNVRVQMTGEDYGKFERAAFSGNDLHGAVIRNVYRSAAGKGGKIPVILLHDCQDTLVTDCVAVSGTPVLVGADGARSGRIRINSASMAGADRVFVPGEGLSKDAVTIP